MLTKHQANLKLKCPNLKFKVSINSEKISAITENSIFVIFLYELYIFLNVEATYLLQNC